MCDVESYSYIPMVEELDYIPTRRCVFGEEILGCLEAMARPVRPDGRAPFHTGVTRGEWQEDEARWLTCTDRCHEISCH